MPRLIHLVRASRQRQIRRGGIRGARWDLDLGAGKPEPIERAVFAMPVLSDFSVTHQWLRELRRWHGEKMVAVHLVLARGEPVLVGRYGKPHARLPLGEAIARVKAEPAGAEIVVPRSITAREVVGIREVTQLVGWTAVPSGERTIDCVCIACLPRGSRVLMRRVHAAYERGLAEARRTDDPHAIAAALSGLEVPLERARGRIPPTKLLGFVRSRHPAVRAAFAQQLSMFRRAAVEPTLLRLLGDDDERVSASAAEAEHRLVGPKRAFTFISRAPIAARVRFVEALAYAEDVDVAVDVLERLRGEDDALDASIRDTAQSILLDDSSAALSERLERLAGGRA